MIGLVRPATRPPTGSAHRGLALIALCMGFGLIQLDATIVNVALPTMQHDLGGSLADLQWTLNGYTIALAAFLLTAGSLADRLGGRRVFLAGLVVFALASAACAAAPNVGVLVGTRIVQGVGGGMLLPASLALIVHQYPQRAERARALGIWGGVSGIGLAGGPVLGGVLVAYASWPVIFLANLPVAALAAILVRAVVPESPRHRHGPLDPAGLALGLVALAGVGAGFIEAGQAGWGSARALGLIAVGAVAAVGFVVVERSVAAPMVPPGLFASRAFSAGTAVGLVFNLCLYGLLLCASLVLQQSRHLGPLAGGLALLPMTVVICAGAATSGRLTARWGPRRPMLAGLGLAAAGAVVLAGAGGHASTGVIIAGTAVIGLCSLAMPAMTATVVGAAPADRAGLASGVLNAARQSGGALGVAVLGSLLTVGGGGLRLTAPALATAVLYVLGLGLAWLATTERRGRSAKVSSG